jgi:hypothetical protein
MFISNFEKARINSRIQTLEICVDNLTKALSAITDQLTEAKQKKPRNGAYWTPEQRRIHGERIRKTWEAKKAAKVAA